MAIASNLGFPRIGTQRQLKRVLEDYWSGQAVEEDLLKVAADIRAENWKLQQSLGLGHIPSGDFSFYDHVLDAAAMLGAVPDRFGWNDGEVGLSTYFAMARGSSGAPAMEMTKWFDTNYHYIVPEFEPTRSFRLSRPWPLEQFLDAGMRGVKTRPVMVGPVSLVLLSKAHVGRLSPLDRLDEVLAVYADMLAKLAHAGAEWVQLDEPALVLDLPAEVRAAFTKTYNRLAKADLGLKLLVATYFGDLRDNLPTAMALPVAAVHLDLVRGPDQLDEALAQLRLAGDKSAGKWLSLGLINGRNIWRADLDAALAKARKAADAIGPDRLMIAPSCSLLHCPVDLDAETRLDAELKSWLAFARQKLAEVVVLTRALNEGESAVASDLAAARAAVESRRHSPRIHITAVANRVADVEPEMYKRLSPYPRRRAAQAARLRLPLLPTTTIGSFPQTREIRTMRSDFTRGAVGREDYEAFLQGQIDDAIRFQERVGLDVLVHGEYERNDMVEYFGEQLDGFAHTVNGWVQSYGSRCVKPPIIYGDIQRPRPMTVRWIAYAASRTDKPVKGMLTGPVTILQWSFVRDDQPRAATCNQIALAIRDEVADLEAAGIGVIQIDEPALREGLPLRRADWEDYLTWSVASFRLASSGVKDETQIHTHMCYSEFNDIIESIAAMDADVISIEASRSQMELLEVFSAKSTAGGFRYPNEIGPGVYDIHSPRVPDRQEMERLIELALEHIPAEQLWVNPDCGLKTRRWEQVEPALTAMVAAAKAVRQRLRTASKT